ncbi:unnamed protein product [Diatraea saccharalis]|uniref:Mitochondrial thiamine pyrophosphate carrier n=1 Tax=Diatraea saccharalis TaxID=40085 RepID=A0A9N9WJT2_9NEOP|nr:unnamed protein product [Diatraea saccharalis]
MVYKTHDATDVTVFQSALAGGAAGGITRAIAQPLDVLKVRFQLQLEPIKSESNSKYKSVTQAVSSIVREEGLATLWSGHIPAQFLSITYGVVQFSVFEKLTQISQRSEPYHYKNNRHWINFTNGGVAATVATIISFPFDTLRTRLIAEQKSQRVYKGFIDAFSTMLKNEGFTSFYKGLFPTLGQIAPHAGIQFAIYKLFTDNVLNRIEYFQRQNTVSGVVESTILGNLLAGSLAGFFAKTAIYPFDLVKKRLQIQGFQTHRESFGRQIYCKGSIHCIKLTIVEEGFLALFKGYAPSTLKAIVVSALHFAVYDEVKYFLMRIQR